MLRDLQYAFRLMARGRWFSLVAVITMALGIGVATAAYALVDAVLIRGLPFAESSRIYTVDTVGRSGARAGVSYPDLLDWQAQSHTFTALAGFTLERPAVVGAAGRSVQWARRTEVTLNTFSVLSETPLIGRDFRPSDGLPGAQPVVILGYALWKTVFNQDPTVVNTIVRIDDTESVVIGVMREGMLFPAGAELWLPLRPRLDSQGRGTRRLICFGRLAPSVTRHVAQAEMNSIAARLAVEYPRTNEGFNTARIETFNERFNGGSTRTAFLVMMASALCLLLIACSNLATLLLSRTLRRMPEFAVRFSLGATPIRLIRQILTESLFTSAVAGVLALGLASLAVAMFGWALQIVTAKPYWVVFRMDVDAVAVLIGLSCLSAVVVGVITSAPLWSRNVSVSLREGHRGQVSSPATWQFAGIVVVQLAVTFTLLATAGLMVRSLQTLYSVDLGIRPNHLAVVRLRLVDPTITSPESRAVLYDELVSKIAVIPGVEAVALATSIPPIQSSARDVEIEPALAGTGQDHRLAVVSVSPGFFDAVGARVFLGRGFTQNDGGTVQAIIVNERFVSRFCAGRNPLGFRVRLIQAQGGPQLSNAWYSIVGVATNIRHSSIQDSQADAALYLPFRLESPPIAFVVIRSGSSSDSAMNSIRREIQRLAPGAPISPTQTVNQMLAAARWQPAVLGWLSTGFAVVALVLSTVGLYSIVAYSVSRRARELGLRLAFGGQMANIAWLILKGTLVQLTMGLVLGAVASVAVGRTLQGLLVQISASDPWTFGLVAVIYVAVAGVACLLPVRHLTQIDPVLALKSE